jgi:hypothetical protein
MYCNVLLKQPSSIRAVYTGSAPTEVTLLLCQPASTMAVVRQHVIIVGASWKRSDVTASAGGTRRVTPSQETIENERVAHRL